MSVISVLLADAVLGSWFSLRHLRAQEESGIAGRDRGRVSVLVLLTFLFGASFGLLFVYGCASGLLGLGQKAGLVVIVLLLAAYAVFCDPGIWRRRRQADQAVTEKALYPDAWEEYAPVEPPAAPREEKDREMVACAEYALVYMLAASLGLMLAEILLYRLICALPALGPAAPLVRMVGEDLALVDFVGYTIYCALTGFVLSAIRCAAEITRRKETVREGTLETILDFLDGKSRPIL